jgi:hypothetical protein
LLILSSSSIYFYGKYMEECWWKIVFWPKAKRWCWTSGERLDHFPWLLSEELQCGAFNCWSSVPHWGWCHIEG